MPFRTREDFKNLERIRASEETEDDQNNTIPPSFVQKPVSPDLFPKQNPSDEAAAAENADNVKEIQNTSKKLEFAENELNSLYNPSYHFRLSVINDLLAFDDDYKGENIKNMPRVVIAETGASQFFIEDVNIETIAGFSPNLRNQNTYNIKMKIAEPRGVQFLDKVYEASNLMGVSSWLKMPFLLELWWKGEDAETGFMKRKATKTRSWIMHANSNEMEVDSKGSSYNFDFTPFDSYAIQDRNINIIDVNFDENVSTLGDFFEKLENTLNKAEEEKAKGQRVPINRYRFKIVDRPVPGITEKINEWRLVPVDYEENSSRQQKFTAESTESREQTHVQFSKGISINKIVENVFGSTKNGAKAIAGTKDDQSTEQRDVSQPFKYVPAIATEMSYTKFDDQTNNWDREIVYYVYLKKYPSNITDSEEIQVLDDGQFQTNRIIRLNRDNTLVKRYDYIYTGNNTEVLNLDLKFNHIWHVPTAWYDGIYTYESETTGKKISTANTEQKKEYLKTQRLLRDAQESFNARRGPPGARRQAEETIKARLVKQFEQVTGNQPSEEYLSRVSLSEREQELRQQQRQIENAERLKNRRQTIISIDEIDQESFPNRKVPITIDQMDYDPRADIDHNTEATWRKTKSIFASALHQVYGMHGDLARIDLQIRGDPYWLGLTNVEKFTSNELNLTQDRESANNLSSELQFLLLFSFPDSTQGLRNLRNHEFASAVYNVTRISSEFSGGKFTQTLQAYRDPKSDVTKIDKSIFRNR